jgi:hypothetical protein
VWSEIDAGTEERLRHSPETLAVVTNRERVSVVRMHLRQSAEESVS